MFYLRMALTEYKKGFKELKKSLSSILNILGYVLVYFENSGSQQQLYIFHNHGEWLQIITFRKVTVM